MPIVKTSPLFSSVSGKFGALIIDINGKAITNGHYKSVHKQRTSLQLLMQFNFDTCRSLWSSLSAAEKASWSRKLWVQGTGSRIGSLVYMPGHALFLQCNLNLLRSSQAVIRSYVVPVLPAMPSNPLGNINIAGTSFALNGYLAVSTRYFIVVYLSTPRFQQFPPVSPTFLYFQGLICGSVASYNIYNPLHFPFPTQIIANSYLMGQSFFLDRNSGFVSPSCFQQLTIT
jgi:hypothetical protein